MSKNADLGKNDVRNEENILSNTEKIILDNHAKNNKNSNLAEYTFSVDWHYKIPVILYMQICEFINKSGDEKMILSLKKAQEANLISCSVKSSLSSVCEPKHLSD